MAFGDTTYKENTTKLGRSVPPVPFGTKGSTTGATIPPVVQSYTWSNLNFGGNGDFVINWNQSRTVPVRVEFDLRIEQTMTIDWVLSNPLTGFGVWWGSTDCALLNSGTWAEILERKKQRRLMVGEAGDNWQAVRIYKTGIFDHRHRQWWPIFVDDMWGTQVAGHQSSADQSGNIVNHLLTEYDPAGSSNFSINAPSVISNPIWRLIGSGTWPLDVNLYYIESYCADGMTSFTLLSSIFVTITLTYHYQ
jgi:hypothetical protein